MDILPGLLSLSQWLDEKGKAIKRNAQNPLGILSSLEQDVQQGAAADKSAWDASRSVMPGVREAGIREMNARGQELGGLLGTFAGVGAKTADVVKLEQAKKMVKAGADPVEVWKQTGWTDQFPDGKWRFEISDDKATKKQHYFTPKQAYAEARTNAFIDGDPEALKRVQSMAPYSDKTTKELVNEYSKTGKAIADAALGGDMGRALALNDARSGLSGLLSQMHQRPYGPASAYIRHADLRAAYPDVATMHTRTYADDLGNANAAYLRKDNGRGEQIAYHAGAPDKSTFLHESQHAIQQREGFARGGSPDGLAATLPETQEIANRLWNEKVAAGMDPSKAAAEALSEARYSTYLKLAGEAEARLTQSRMNLTPAERAARPPWLEFDVPREQQIVRGLLGEPTGPAMSVREPTKFQLAHAEAQRNAALPVEQGGLGLGPNNTAMERAKAMGFDTDVYHGTHSRPIGAGKETPDIKEFVPSVSFGSPDPAVFVTRDTGMANAFARNYVDNTGAIYPLKVRTNAGQITETADHARNNEMLVHNPALLRSRFAAFDPKKRNSRDLLASMGLLGLLGAGAYGEEQ